MAEPSKQYRARIWVKLTDELLPSPVLSKTEVEARLKDALKIGEPDSPIIGIAVDDPRS